ncbi:hypothetical protein COOONC_17907 [Cooperia oncophora]
MVETPSGTKRMDQLKIGDLVLTAEVNSTVFTPVVSFLHRLPDTVASFIKLQTDDGELKLTPQHFIYKVGFQTRSMNRLLILLFFQSQFFFSSFPVTGINWMLWASL